VRDDDFGVEGRGRKWYKSLIETIDYVIGQETTSSRKGETSGGAGAVRKRFADISHLWEPELPLPPR